MDGEKRRNQPSEDDGRTIANMNVEGMPWYTAGGDEPPEVRPDGYRMTREERGAYIWAAVRSGLLIMLVFAVVFFLFMLFCDQVWFR